MSTHLETYTALVAAQARCKDWASLIGSPFRGGGGGIGALQTLRICIGDDTPKIYHQSTDGAQNYHRMPPELRPHLEAAIMASIGGLLEDALNRQQESLRAAAAAAIQEHTALMLAAGLQP